MVDLISDSDDSGDFEWESDGEVEPSSVPASRNFDAPGPSTLAQQDTNGRANGTAPSATLVGEYVGMGFPKEMVIKCIKENEHGDANTLLELLLTYKALSDDTSVGDPSTSVCFPKSVEDDDDDDFDFENWDGDNDAGGREPDSDSSGGEDFLKEMSEMDKKINLLMGMGFPEEEANMAVNRCGVDAAIDVLIDSIYASEDVGGCHSRDLSDHKVMARKKKRKQYEGGAWKNQAHFAGSDDELMPLPNPMVGFSLPNDRARSVNRRLSEQAIGPPFFYYENVACAPKGVWTTISRFLYDIEPEFVDSKYMCAANRKRGYIHNLPLVNRSPLLPLPAKTIFEAFPHYKKWWPLWDSRRQLNCLQTCVASAELMKRIRLALSGCDNPPPEKVQRYVMKECRKWNLVWIGKNKVAPLEPDEYEFLLGFPRDHTRGFTKTERYKSLGNSFQVDTVAYHLSVLRGMYPNGMNVLSLFTGIGGGEVALHRLGIHMKIVVSVEISDVNREILRTWWDQTQQSGQLIEIPDVQTLTNAKIEAYVKEFRGFDLVIGGSPCNNLAGSNRHHRDGLEGEQSSLFYHYVRILDAVRSTMVKM